MKRFLSIDWDFFIGATDVQRALLFPDGGNENMPDSLKNYIWDSHYRCPELSSIKVSDDYKYLLKFCRDFSGKCMISDSHKFAYDFIMENTTPREKFNVYNIDFHHDLYNYRSGDEKVNCGNWATVLREERPNMVYNWVKCEDSDLMTTGGEKVDSYILDMWSFNDTFGKDISGSFDYLYLCRSAMWSPPHLDPKFVKAVKILMKKCPTKYEQGIDKPRPYEIPTDFSEYLAMANAHKSSEEKWGVK